MAGRAWLATNTYHQMRPLTFPLERQKFTSPAPRGLELFHLLCFNLLPFQCDSVSTRGPPFPSFSKPPSQDILGHILDPQSQFGRDHMAGGFSEAGGNHFTGSRIQWQQLSQGLSLDRPSLLPGCSLGGEARRSRPRGEAHQAGLPHEPGVQRCVRCCCCGVCRGG